MRLSVLLMAMVMTGLIAAGCTTTEKRTAQGAGIGALAGGAIGGLATGTGTGVLVGAAVGAGTGALIGAATSPGDCYYRRPNGSQYVAPCP